MNIALGKFARSGIEARLGTDVAVGVQEALLHYTRRLRSGWPPVGIPQFCRERAAQDPEAEFELAIGPETEAALERDARRQRVSLAQVLTHAVFVYLADLDSAPETSRMPGTPLL